MPIVLDPRQLARIEAVHRGFLYQHLYATNCLLTALEMGATSVIVEQDEDVEISLRASRKYLQIKTRATTLQFSDISNVLPRFEALRQEHISGRRPGDSSFAIVSNVSPGEDLLRRLETASWPSYVSIHWPGSPQATGEFLPKPNPDVSSAFSQCMAAAERLPYALLSPETLVWKLAGNVMAAAAGIPPRMTHTFDVADLPALFEQVVIQLQQFPSPPTAYRSIEDEPSLDTPVRIRIVTGFSGAGKTAWASQSAIHAPHSTVYFDVLETPGPALATTLARELAARLFGEGGSGRLGEILLPGASGREILQLIGTRLAAAGQEALVVLDNAHRAPPGDLHNLLQHAPGLRFVLLCQPGRHVYELETRLSIAAEQLRGWSVETVAAVVNDFHCRADYDTCQRLVNLTGGLPLYIQSAVAIVGNQYSGSTRRFCDDLEATTHVVETAQEIILARSFDALNQENRNAIALLGLADIPLTRSESMKLLQDVLKVTEVSAASAIREMRASGYLELFAGDRLKVHDAMRLLGMRHLIALDKTTEAQLALIELLTKSLENHWELPKLSLLVRLLAATNNVSVLVDMTNEELFHELGLFAQIESFLERAAASDETNPEDRFWALDSLVLSNFKRRNQEGVIKRIELMGNLIADHGLGKREILAHAMKRMNVLAEMGDQQGVIEMIRKITIDLPDTPSYQRIFRYNAANALYSLRRFEPAIEEATELIGEYLNVLGITPKDILGRNPDQIWPRIKQTATTTDDLKHLADCFDLRAHALNSAGLDAVFNRINAMKFYQMSNAVDSLVRVAQDLVDEFVGRHDFIGARQVIETNLLPNITGVKMVSRLVPVRSQYAVVLAYCGDYDAADAEMARLHPFEGGLEENGKKELQNQRTLIAELRRNGPPPQWIPNKMGQAILARGKIGQNQLCICGSGRKYKRCHGAII